MIVHNAIDVLTERQMGFIVDGGDNEENDPEFADIECVGKEENLGMDSHGCNHMLTPFRIKSTDILYGLVIPVNSEESFPDEARVFKIVAKEVTVTKYLRADGKKWKF